MRPSPLRRSVSRWAIPSLADTFLGGERRSWRIAGAPCAAAACRYDQFRDARPGGSRAAGMAPPAGTACPKEIALSATSAARRTSGRIHCREGIGRADGGGGDGEAVVRVSVTSTTVGWPSASHMPGQSADASCGRRDASPLFGLKTGVTGTVSSVLLARRAGSVHLGTPIEVHVGPIPPWRSRDQQRARGSVSARVRLQQRVTYYWKLVNSSRQRSADRYR